VAIFLGSTAAVGQIELLAVEDRTAEKAAKMAAIAGTVAL
jgi:hypothetical protein